MAMFYTKGDGSHKNYKKFNIPIKISRAARVSMRKNDNVLGNDMVSYGWHATCSVHMIIRHLQSPRQCDIDIVVDDKSS